MERKALPTYFCGRIGYLLRAILIVLQRLSLKHLISFFLLLANGLQIIYFIWITFNLSSEFPMYCSIVRLSADCRRQKVTGCYYISYLSHLLIYTSSKCDLIWTLRKSQKNRVTRDTNNSSSYKCRLYFKIVRHNSSPISFALRKCLLQPNMSR